MAKGERERMRVRYSSKVEVKRAHKSKKIVGQLRDIGMNSIYGYFDFETFPERGEDVDVTITIKGTGSKLSIESSGKVVRVDKNGFAVVFSKRLEWWPIFVSFPQHAKYYKGLDPM